MSTVLRHYRVQIGLSQEELASRVGISQPALSNYENGLKIPEPTAKKIVEVFRSFNHIVIPTWVVPDSLTATYHE